MSSSSSLVNISTKDNPIRLRQSIYSWLDTVKKTAWYCQLYLMIWSFIRLYWRGFSKSLKNRRKKSQNPMTQFRLKRDNLLKQSRPKIWFCGTLISTLTHATLARAFLKLKTLRINSKTSIRKNWQFIKIMKRKQIH